MNIKIIVANNDILYSNLSNTILENKSKIESKIEIIKISENKLNSFIYKNKVKDNFIIIDTLTSTSFCSNIIKNAINRIGNEKRNIVILVIDFQNLVNTINQYKNLKTLKKKNNAIVFTLDIINIVTQTIKETFELEKEIENTLWKLGFVSYFKGYLYLKDAILMVYNDRSLLQDNTLLIKRISKKNNISNAKVVRSVMDKTLSNVLDLIDNTTIYNVFGDFYDGRKMSLKYFIDLFIHYLEKKKYCCLNGKNTLNK